MQHPLRLAMPLHSDVVVPYNHEFGNDAQKKCWPPRLVSGEAVAAVAMTEPGTGSDLAALSSSPRKPRRAS